MAEAIIVFSIVLILIAIVDVSALPLELGFIQLIRIVFKKLNLYGVEKDVAEDNVDIDTYVGSTATTTSIFEKAGTAYHGRILLNGVSWSALCEDEQLKPGVVVQIIKQNGICLKVKKIKITE